MQALGRIVSFHQNKHGDIDGFDLDEDTIVRFPPHLGALVTSQLKLGTKVDVQGRRHRTSHGEIHLHAESLRIRGKRIQLRDSSEREDIAEDRPPRPDENDWMTKQQADQMIDELRKIRLLLEKHVK